MSCDHNVFKARSRLGTLSKNGTPDEIVNARRDLAAALIAKRVREILAAAPPLTPAQVAGLVGILQAAPTAPGE